MSNKVTLANFSSESTIFHDDLEQFYGPFLQKLGELSSEYELEKASLEREMLRSLNEVQSGTTKTIIEQRASARHYLNVVNEFYQRMHSLVMDSLHLRRNAEQRFAQKLLDITKAEHDHIIFELRAEDKKKIIFAKNENDRKLEHCRTAVKVDLAGMLLQQRAALERAKAEEINNLTKTWERERIENQKVVKGLQEQIKLQERKATEERVARSCSMRDITSELDELKMENENLTQAHKQLKQSEKNLREEINMLENKLESSQEEFRTAEEQYLRKLNDMKADLVEQQNQLDLSERRYIEKCDEFDRDLSSKENTISELSEEINQLMNDKQQLEQDVSDLEHDFGVLSRMLDTEKAERQEDARQFQATFDDQTEKLNSQQDFIAKLLQEATFATHKIDSCERDIKTLQDKLAKSTEKFEDMAASLKIWLFDEICLRSYQPFDLEYDGHNGFDVAQIDYLSSSEHKDLLYLLHLIEGFGSDYRTSPQRIEISEMTYFSRKEGSDEGGRNAAANFLQEKANSRSSSATSSVSQPAVASISRPGSRGSFRKDELTNVDQNSENSTMQIEKLQKQLTETQNHCEEKLREWKTKCIALAQRLSKAEEDLNMPRQSDVTKIKDLEGQVKALVWALQSAPKGPAKAEVRKNSRGA